MAYCRYCGAEMPDKSAYCPSCGAAVEGSRNTGGFNTYSSANDIEDNRLISILCYFGILFLIPYLTKPESQFVRFHSNQGLVLLLFLMAAGIASRIPFLGWIIGIVCGIFAFVCFIIGIVNVCNGEMKELPIIGQIRIIK